MEPLGQNDYYGIFQTGLLIAVEEFGVKQAHIAALCGISNGYLSKLKGWQLEAESGRLVPRRHVVNTNFKHYAVPLVQFLDQQHQIYFSDGYFIERPGNPESRKWGHIYSIQLPAQKKNKITPETPEILAPFHIPSKGQITIEITVDLADRDSVNKILDWLTNLTNTSLGQLNISLILHTKDKHNSGFNIQNQDEPENLYAQLLQDQTEQLDHSNKIDLQIIPGYHGHSELVSIYDSETGIRREQFCDFSSWEALHHQGQWAIDAAAHTIQGSGMHQYLLSRYSYGTHNYTIEAVLRFEGYEKNTDEFTDNANAGIVLGWQKVDGHNQYYNLLMDGQTIRLERIGARSGDHYADFQHLDWGVPFEVENGMEYQFQVRINSEQIRVYVDNILRYQVATPAGMKGQVGIRPWRSQITCSYYEIWEEG